MAKILTGPIISEIRGKCGDITFSRNRGGMFSRANGVRVQPWSAYQIALREIAALAGARWNANLTEDQRQAWNALAASTTQNDQLNQAAPLSGQNWCFRINMAGLTNDAGTYDDPPVDLSTFAPPLFSSITAIDDPPSLLLNFSRDVYDTEFFVIQATNSLNVGVYNFTHRFCLAALIEEPGALPYEAIDSYLAHHSPLILGKKLALQVRSMKWTNTILSRPTQATTVVQSAP